MAPSAGTRFDASYAIQERVTTAAPSDPRALPNPERRWAPRGEVSSIGVEEVERCLGHAIDEPCTVLSGGLANTNLRIGSRVVRIHRRDPATAHLEARLLGRPWASFRVPSLLRRGDGFLVLEYVDHGPLLGTLEHGASAGRALAEIHSVTFASAGDLEPSTDELRVGQPFADLVGALVGYAGTQLADERGGLASELRSRTVRALEGAAPVLRDVAGPPLLLHGDFKASNLHWAADERLLVLDWEFAYVGAALSDIGQLLRWEPPRPFVEGFAAAYRDHGGHLVDDWERWAAAFDLVNLAGLLANLGGPDATHSARARDVAGRIEKTLSLLG